MIFNPKKFQFAKEEVEYAGFVVGNDTIRPTDSYLQAIADLRYKKLVWVGKPGCLQFLQNHCYATIRGTPETINEVWMDWAA